MKTIFLTHLYPKSMSIYGDLGNIITMKDVLEYNGLKVCVQNVEVGDPLPLHTDWYFIGGGADKSQLLVSQDLQQKSSQLLNDLQNGIPLLAICGGYQLLGKEFVCGDGSIAPGLGWFPVTTQSPDSLVSSRCVGNIVIHTTLGNTTSYCVGFENHGGQTRPTDSSFTPLGTTLVGYGNNSQDKQEGCIKNNSIGCYLHGPCLAKNPTLIDFFYRIITDKNADKLPPEYHQLHNTLIERFGTKKNP